MAKWQLGEPCQTAAKAVATNYNYIMRNIRIKGPRKKKRREKERKKRNKDINENIRYNNRCTITSSLV